MIRTEVESLTPIPKLTLLGLLVVGLAASTVLAQASGTWMTTGSLNTGRLGHTATLLPSGQVLVAGGETSSGTILASAELYNPATGQWTTVGSMANARINHTATLLPNGEVLVVGGSGVLNPQAPCLATAELYNPATGQWRTTGNMNTARFSQGAALLQTGEVLVAGGDICWGYSGGASPGASAELYNPSSSTWKTTGSMNASLVSPMTLLQDGRALLGNELYSPSAGRWSLTSNMKEPEHLSLAAALLANGNVLIYGDLFAYYAGEFYNPVTNVWTETMGNCYTGLTVAHLVLLANGKALLGGGSDRYSGHSYPETNCDLYDPSTNRWTSTGRLHQAGSHTLTLLSNGQVLAVGGADAELYTP